ncbi:MAG: FAD-dependent oxidoreductase [Candidatus Izemoplasmataceae bacterium]
MFDVIIIGSGISGACIARECAKYQMNTLVLEKNIDVASETTLANSAIIHAGHDPLVGSLKAKYNIIGSRMYEQMSKELDIPYLKNGGMVVATNEEEIDHIKMLYDRGLANGLKKDEIALMEQAKVRQLEPNISDDVLMALYLPTTAITYPMEAAIANLENAMDNGVHLQTDAEVIDIKKNENYFEVYTSDKVYKTKYIINAAGLYAEKISDMVVPNYFKITPRRGEYLVLDKDVHVVSHVIYPVPSKKGKGILATPQYHGNLLLGPTSEFVQFDEMKQTSSKGLNDIKNNIKKSVKNIPFNKVIRTFAGSRPTPSTKDFIIEETMVKGFINVAGIESPGLSAAPAYAEYVVEELLVKNGDFKPNTSFNPIRKRVNRMNELSIDEKNILFKKNHTYGEIICRCEQVTKGEIIDSITRNAGAKTVVGVKHRTRAGAGRCQSGFCQVEVSKILAEYMHIPLENVLYQGKHSNIVKEKTKGETNERI